MASSQLSSLAISIDAAADLSAKQYFFIAADGDVAGAGEPALGALLNKPTSGQAASIQIGGVAKVVFGASIAVGTEVASSATGKAAAAATGDAVLGVVISDGGADGQIGEVLLHIGAEKN